VTVNATNPFNPAGVTLSSVQRRLTDLPGEAKRST